jgi:hypothetical protein
MTNWNLIPPDDRQYLDEFGDLNTAMDLVRGINDEIDTRPDIPEFRQRLRTRFMTDQNVRDIGRGCMNLVMFAAARFPQSPLDFLPAAIRKLEGLNDVPDDVLPLLAGGLTATFLGNPADEWRDRLGPVPREESLAWIFAAWSIVSFVDFCNQEKGYALRALENTIIRILDEDICDTKG